jgi:hypothetical protein
MAIEKSEHLVNKAFENAYFVPNIKNKFLKKIIKIFLIKLLSLFRKAKFYFVVGILHPFLFYFSLNLRDKNNVTTISVKELSQYSNDYNKKNFIFIENFIDIDFYNKLINDFPNKMYFKHKNDPTKFYYWGFEYLSELINDKYLNFDGQLLSKFAFVEKYYNFILSNLFSENFKKMIQLKDTKSEFSLKVLSINATYADSGAFLIPHKDSAYLLDSSELVHNCIHFIDGDDSNIEESGGTGLYLDNEFQKKVFIPSTLKNSLLVYNTKANLFHGFNFIKKNSFRKAFAFQIIEKKFN